MGIFDNIRNIFKASDAKPYTYTDISTWNDYTQMVDNKDLLPEFIGYTYLASDITASAAASTPMRLYRKSRGGKLDEVTEGDQLYYDITRFNEGQSMWEGRYLLHLHLSLVGDAFQYMCQRIDGAKGIEFFMINPSSMEVRLDKEHGLPMGYRKIDANGQYVEFDKSDIVHYRLPNPIMQIRGYSPLAASVYQHNTWIAMSKHVFNYIMNDARPSGMLTLEGAQREQVEKLETMLRAKYSGPEKRGRVSVTNLKAEYTRMMDSNEDMQFEQGIQRMKEDILAFHRVPRDLLIGGTYENSSESQRIFQTYNTQVRLTLEADILNKQLLPKYFGKTQDLYVFKADNPVQKDATKNSQIVTSLYQGGIITLNEAREEAGWDSIQDPKGEEFVKREVISNIPPKVQADPDKETQKSIEKLVKHIKRIETQLGSTFSAKSMREELKFKLFDYQLTKEQLFQRYWDEYWMLQIQTIFPQDLKKMSVKKVGLDLNEQLELGKKVVGQVVDRLALDFFALADDLVGREKTKDIRTYVVSIEAKRQLSEILEKFLTDVNKNTQEDLNKIIIDAVENDLTVYETQLRTIQLYDNYFYGTANVDVLTAGGVWIPKTITTDGVITPNSVSRLDDIYGQILSKDPIERIRLLEHFVATIESYTDEGRDMLRKIEENFGIKKNSDAMSFSRSERIVRTEVNTIKGIAIHDRYEQDDEVEGTEWVSALDTRTREAHMTTDGQVIRKGEKYIVDGEAMSHPGDSSASAKNRINCRCTEVPVLKEI